MRAMDIRDRRRFAPTEREESFKVVFYKRFAPTERGALENLEIVTNLSRKTRSSLFVSQSDCYILESQNTLRRLEAFP